MSQVLFTFDTVDLIQEHRHIHGLHGISLQVLSFHNLSNYDLVCSVNKYEKTNMVFSTDAAITNVFDLENSYAYQYYNAFLGKVVVYMDLLTKTSISTLDSKTIAWVKNGTNNTYNFEWTQPVTSGDALFRFTKPNTSTGLVIRLQSGTIASGVHIYVRFEYDIY